MSIKINTGSVDITALEATKDSADILVEKTIESTTKPAIDNYIDPVSQIASDVAAGKISGEQAVDKLIEETMGSKMLESAPKEMRLELENILRNMIETDPHLQSLARDLGVKSKKTDI